MLYEDYLKLSYEEQLKVKQNLTKEARTDLVEGILREATEVLSCGNEDYIPAIKFAIRYMERGYEIELGMGDEPL
jgi:hypothetical protein